MKLSTKKAQSLIEYGLILALVAVIAVTILGKFGETMTKSANKTNETVENAADNAAKSYCDSLSDPEAKSKCESLLNSSNDSSSK